MLWREESPYHALGLPPDVDKKEITAAYSRRRRQVRGAESRQIRAALDELSNPEKRAVVDALLFQEAASGDGEEALQDLLATQHPAQDDWFAFVDGDQILRQDARTLLASVLGAVWAKDEAARLLPSDKPVLDISPPAPAPVQPLLHSLDQYLLPEVEAQKPSWLQRLRAAPRREISARVAAVLLALFVFTSLLGSWRVLRGRVASEVDSVEVSAPAVTQCGKPGPDCCSASSPGRRSSAC